MVNDCENIYVKNYNKMKIFELDNSQQQKILSFKSY